MKIKKAEHKALLNFCYLEEAPQGTRQKIFNIDKLLDAGNAFKKLREGSKEKKRDNLIFFEFTNKEVTFIPSEIAILKELFDEKCKKGFSAEQADVVMEIKNIFEGKTKKT